MNPVVNVKCNLCNSDDYRIMYPSTVKNIIPTVEEYTSTINIYSLYHNIVKCNKCGLIYMNPRDDKTFELYEQVVDNAYLETWEERADTFRKHLKIIEKYKPKGELLDVGCYAGIFLTEAQKKGYSVKGIEPSSWGADYAKKKTGAEIINKSSDKPYFPDNSFDIITMWDVIEHLEEPSKCLSIAYNYLNKDGVIVLTTHDIGSLFARIMGKKYPWLMRFHLFHFTPETLSAMLKKAGFKIESVKYYSKRFSFKYLLSRFKINVRSNFFSRCIIPINMFDGFMIIAKK